MRERDWASLERGLLRDIFVRLHADVDAAHFRRVCHGWRDGAGAGAPVPRPWLVIQPSRDGPAHAFVRPAERRRRRTRLRPVTREDQWPPASARGASRGWLAVNEGKRLLLRDPISRAEVPLPAFDAGYQLFDIFLSDDPLAAPGRCTAFAFFRSEHDDGAYPSWHVLAFCRPGDAEWGRFDAGNDGQYTWVYRGLEFYGGRAYVLLASPSKIAICDVEARRLVVTSVWIPLMPGGQECLVECDGGLMAVQVSRHREAGWSMRCIGGRSLRGRDRVSFSAKAFRIEFGVGGSSGVPVAVSEVESIGDNALFVAPQGHAFALPASDFPGVRPGCVYSFAIDAARSVKGMVVVDMQADADGTRRDTIVRKLPLAGKWHLLSWFCPRCPVLDTTPARRRR